MRAAYRNPSESRSENSIPCRQPIPQPVLTPQNEHFAQAGVHLGMIAATLDDLVEMGFLTTYRDENNIVRYKPTGGRIA